MKITMEKEAGRTGMNEKKVMRHLFHRCALADHQNCEETFEGDLHTGECICQCHLVSVIRGFLNAQNSREDMERKLYRYGDFV